MKWDLTTRKRASKKYHIIKCPVCGKYGQAVVYVESDRTPKFVGMVKHKGHTELGFNMIDESCTLTQAHLDEME